jgi:OPT family oligopeptide transporter
MSETPIAYAPPANDHARIEVRNEGGVDAPEPAAPIATGDAALDLEIKWLREVYQGDQVKQATARAILMGAILGGALSLQNLYVGLKTGWGLGVAITACVLSYTIYSGLVRLAPRVFGAPMTILENNAMQSTASSAGYSTGGVMTSAMAAYLLVSGKHVPPLALTLWTFFMAVLGTVMAIPMKRQMINIEQLKFPSGIAAAETLRSLHAEGEEAAQKARALGWAGAVGAAIAWFRDAHVAADLAQTHPRLFKAFYYLTYPSEIPGQIEFPTALPLSRSDFGKWLKPAAPGAFPTLTIAGIPAAKLTVVFEGSLIMIAAGALMGMRTTISMIVAATINYAGFAPWLYGKGVLHELGYRGIVKWSVWPGASLMVTSGLLTFVLQWRTVVRAFSGLGAIFGKKKQGAGDPYRTYENPAERERAEWEARVEAVEVPPSWFLAGVLFAGTGLVVVGKWAFGIGIGLGALAVALTFVLALVAARATGETDTTPVGAMGKITQLTYALVAKNQIVTNLMAASITAGAATSSADLLTDLKSGYLLGANPRKQFIAQLVGTFVGTAVVVPVFYVLVPTPGVLGGDKFPAPSAQVWASVARLLSQGIHTLDNASRWGIAIGGLIGILLPLLEMWFPKRRAWVPSAMGVGLALVIPWFNSFSMFVGALMVFLWEKRNADKAERYTVAISSGIIAGESLMGVLVVLLGTVLHWLE